MSATALPPSLSLFTDLYQLTMGQAYDAEALNQPAVFELFFRVLPPARNYLVAAGLADVLAYLQDLRFTDDDLSFLEQHLHLSARFLDRLRAFRFSGEVWAMAEGTPVFANEPLVQVIAPMLEAQLVETYIINQVHFQTLAAAKAARVVSAAEGRMVVEFGARRAHGVDAAVKVARASYLVGATGTSNVLAGRRYGIPLFGTMAHSYVQAHDDELEAFTAFSCEFPTTTLLVDTYDTLAGVRKVIELARRLGDRFQVQSLRLDSGDLADLAAQTRQLLDEAGLRSVRIFASSNLDEFQLEKLVQLGAPIDGFGVGTQLATLADVPNLDMAYKLVEYDGQPRMKLSSTAMKAIFPGRKQVYRHYDADGRLHHDTVAAFHEDCSGTPLLQPVMRQGQLVPAASVPLAEARRRTCAELRRLPESLRALTPAPSPFPVEFSQSLQTIRIQLRQKLQAAQ